MESALEIAPPVAEREGFAALVPDAAFEMLSKSDSVRARAGRSPHICTTACDSSC
jgi:hypothetical protein